MRSIPPDLARHALDAAPDAMLIMDDDGRLLFANRHCSSLFDHPHAELVRLRFEDLVPGRDGQRRSQLCATLAETSGFRAGQIGREVLAQRRDGAPFPAELSVSAVDSPQGRFIAVAIRDVSDRKRTESELVVARVLAERAQAAADAARASADRANLAKGRFLATASHDLRQPLQALALLNRSLRSLVADPAAQGVLAQQEHNIRAMSRLLNALLDVSKLESGAIKAEPAPCGLSTLFAELRVEFEELAEQKGLALSFEGDDRHVFTDPSLLEEVLRNLIGNALKYTARGGVTVRAVTAGAGVRIEVADTGIGIPADQLALIFEEFYQIGVTPSSTREGYGLGLSIVQRIAALLGTQVTVRSTPGRGSTFALVLPVALAAAPEARANAGAPVEANRPKRSACILLVEDDPAVRGATELLLTVEGHEVVAVASLEEARQAAEARADLGLLITDFHLAGGETGMQVVETVRRARGAELKAVLVTGDTSSLMRRVRVDQNLRMLSKPVEADELLALIEELAADAGAANADRATACAAGGAPARPARAQLPALCTLSQPTGS